MAYVVGYRRLARRRRTSGFRPQTGFFVAGYVILLVALLSPLHAVGEEYFSVHMIQHLLLSLVAPPLLLISNSMPVLVWALPREERARVGSLVSRPGPLRRLLRLLTHPVVAWFLFVGTQWFWHQSYAYQWALENRLAHYLEHITFFATAVLFWLPVIGTPPLHARMRFPARLAYTFLAWMPNSLLGAGITLSRAPLYAHYVSRAQAIGGDATADQQLAGLIMWIPGDLTFITILLVLFVAYLQDEERRAERIDRELDAQEASAQVR